MSDRSPQRPSRQILAFYTAVNMVLRFWVRAFGKSRPDEQDALRLLRVRGRKSGKSYEIPIRLAIFEQRRYAISLLGDSQWSRNVRANGQVHLVVGASAQPVNATEVFGEEKQHFLSWYCLEPINVSRVRSAARIDPRHVSEEEMQRRMLPFPVFRFDSMPESAIAGSVG